MISIEAREYLSRRYETRTTPRASKACNRRPIKYYQDVWASRLQDCTSTVQTHNALTVGCRNMEWFNNSGQTAQLDR
jgi:hypothetical protein